jgi:isopenicillin N synthase-like dioxygenase
MAKLAAKILSAFALGLQLDEDYFERFVDHHGSALRLYLNIFSFNFSQIIADNKLKTMSK